MDQIAAHIREKADMIRTIADKLTEYKKSPICEVLTGKKQVPPKSGIKPIVLNQVRDLAQRHGITRVILFGSRARGDFQEKSDIDLAVSGGDAHLFRLAVEEETDTLLRFDVVDLDTKIDQKLLENIQREGVVLYEKV